MSGFNLSASICYYGGDIPKLKDLEPKCKVLTHFGELDKGIPINDVKIFEKQDLTFLRTHILQIMVLIVITEVNIIKHVQILHSKEH